MKKGRVFLPDSGLDREGTGNSGGISSQLDRKLQKEKSSNKSQTKGDVPDNEYSNQESALKEKKRPARSEDIGGRFVAAETGKPPATAEGGNERFFDAE